MVFFLLFRKIPGLFHVILASILIYYKLLLNRVYDEYENVSFICAVMLNKSRHHDRNKTSTCYEPIIQFWKPVKERVTLIKRHVNL